MNEARATPTASEPLRLLHLTDFHLFAEGSGELRGVNTDRSLAAVIEHFSASRWPARQVLATGDFVQDDSAAAYRRCRRHLESLGLPVLLCPGNHDVRTVMSDLLAGEPLNDRGIERLGRWSLIALDSCVDGEAGGQLGDDELDRLETHLEETAADFVLVCLHHPPVALGSRWLDSVGLADGEALLRIADRSGKLRGIVFGHAHQPFDRTDAGVRLLGTPSTCGQFKPGSDDFAVDDRPPAYRLIELGADGTIGTQLIWIDHA